MSTNEKELEARIAELEATVQRLRPETAKPEDSDRPVNRRTMLRMAAAAAGGAVVAPMVFAKPAAANNNDPILIANANTTTAGSAGTTYLTQGLASDNSQTHFQVKHASGDVQPTGVVTGAPLWGTGSNNGEGILGWAPGAAGYGVIGGSDSGYGLVGDSGTGVDLALFGTGRLLQISNFSATGVAPTFDPSNWETVRDTQGVVWLSGGSATGGNWRRGNNVIPITPVRVWDSRNAGGAPGDGPAAPTGALAGPFNAVTTVTLTLGGYRGIPTAISGLLCVLTVITPSTGGFIKAYPGGASAPLAVVGNFPAAGIVSFYPIVGTGTSGANVGKLTVQIAAGTGVHVGLDVTGYLI